MPIKLHQQDLPDDLDLGAVVAVDTEAMGLDPHRDRLCLVQLAAGDGVCRLVQFRAPDDRAPSLRRLGGVPAVVGRVHVGRGGLAVWGRSLGVRCRPVYCTKIASKLARTYTDRHGLRDLCQELLGIDLSKQMQSSDWGALELTEAQLNYAAGDVLHLHRLRQHLDGMLEREGRQAVATACFAFLPERAELDLAGWAHHDIFAY
jgi:ribonuclease D